MKFTDRIKGFFFPPSESPLWLKVLPYALLGLLTLIVLLGGAYAWDYTNSPQFCGTTCHTMPPEYTAYLTSPHARIDCVDCHIGKGFITTKITRKAGDAEHIISMLFKRYEYPIRVKSMRPARETCELCHFPEKFSDDSLRKLARFAQNVDNTETTIYLVLKTGGGSKRLGLGKGIHWHVENKVYYLPLDTEEQNIPYIQVVHDDGTTTEYVDVEANFDPTTINPANLKEMDCITCHNRITHLLKQPEQIIDSLMENGTIRKDIPEFKRQAVARMRQRLNDKQLVLNSLDQFEEFYALNYPQYYAEHTEDIRTAIRLIKEAYAASVFPEQKADWDSHPNNVGHLYSPGCFRCHDGKHLNANNEAIRLECNLCHSIPVVAHEGEPVADIEIYRGPEPESHQNPNWISVHHEVFNPTCANCHSMEDPGGTSDTSFCSNSACHGIGYTYAGFDAPNLRQILLENLPVVPTPPPPPPSPTLGSLDSYQGGIGELFTTRCGACHGEAKSGGLQLTTYQGLMAGGKDGAVINPGDAQNSLLIQKLTAERPHFGQLTPEELQAVIDWINRGAPER
ncbi:MAG: hypothetical protein Kow0088_22890 [Anaerolineales bacterium]